MRFKNITALSILICLVANAYTANQAEALLPGWCVAILGFGLLVYMASWVIELFSPNAFELEMKARTRAQKAADRKAWNPSRNGSSASDGGSAGSSWGGHSGDCGGGSCGGGGGGDGGGGGGD